MKKTIRFKQPPKCPRCPNMEDARNDFRKLSELMRETRHRYRVACCDKASDLKGEALARFMLSVAQKMSDNGLYAPTTYYGDIVWSIARAFFQIETGRDWWGWLSIKQLTLDDLRRFRRRRRGVA